MVNKKPRCTFDLRINCLQVDDKKLNCGTCPIGNKLRVKKVSLTFIAK